MEKWNPVLNLKPAVTGHLLPHVITTEQPSERPLYFETCRKVNSHCSAETAAGKFADYFCYGVTRHRPGNLTEWRRSDFLCDRTRCKTGRGATFRSLAGRHKLFAPFAQYPPREWSL